MIKIYNENCEDTLSKLEENSIDVVLTSPPYNTTGYSHTLDNSYDQFRMRTGSRPVARYDLFSDDMSIEEYNDFTVRLFNGFDRIVKPNGCVLYNIMYGTANTTGWLEAMLSVVHSTQWTIKDIIIWKKLSATPNNVSPNSLTRVCEFVFVMCRKSEVATMHCNKNEVSESKSGQKIYENLFNFITAKNNDENCNLNKATYSSELCEKLLSLYAPVNGTVYDPFMGTGTTAVACSRLGFNCYGSELSPKQCEWAQNRLSNMLVESECVDSEGNINSASPSKHKLF
jgi:site-specific DNA-methyltransferase (adenine-specific)/modification methylase